MPYNHLAIEKKWIQIWTDSDLYKTPDIQIGDKKKYILEAFPYPSGDGLHVGHALPMTAGDITSRYYRMNGYSVLHPMGWDSFGLPTENFAKKKGLHPQEVTNNAIANFTKQIHRLGIDYDWNKELTTSSPEYYKWTQWFFQLLYKRGLAYKKEALVNWDPIDMTVLANEQVLADGTAERSGAKVEQKMMSQWFFKITDYAEKLLTGLEKLDWPESTKLMQKNWIGKSVGAEVEFKVEDSNSVITVFTTRIDTLFSGTFLILAPDNNLVDNLTTPEQFEEVYQYKEKTKQKSQFERSEMNKEKTGAFTGSYAINPATGDRMPIWVSDFVLASYGTGTVFADAHDERDFDMAKKFNIPLKTSLKPEGVDDDLKIRNLEECFSGYGILYNSGQFDGLKSKDAMPKIIAWGESQGWAKARITYRLRDWSIGRQRYWGCPIPVIYNDKANCEIFLVDAVNTLITKDGEEFVLNIELAKYLQTLTQKKTVVTNAKDKVFIQIKELLKTFDFEVFSLGFEPKKTNPEYYKTLIDKFDLDLTKTFYFDHSNDNLESAKNSGIESVQFLNNTQIISILNDRIFGTKLIPESDLPVLLPQDLDLSAGMIKPLRSNVDFVNSASQYGEGWTREGDTMDTFVCSSWYFFRYCSGNIENEFANPEDMKAWMPVDQYIIGAEHSTMHLLYARFFTKVLFDAGYIDFDEPFAKMRHQGLILGPDNAKMSKSKGNVINPNEVFDEYGADTLRMYEMFMGPFDQSKPWSTSSIKGVRRFLDRVWNMQERVTKEKSYKNTTKTEYDNFTNEERSFYQQNYQHIYRNPNYKVEVGLNKLIKKISEDIENYGFNTCVSEFMKFVNLVEDTGAITNDQFQRFLLCLAPFAPFITEEIWSIVSVKATTVSPQYTQSIHAQQFPTYDPALTIDNTVTIGVQINGKVRGKITLSPNATEQQAAEKLFKDMRNEQFVDQYITGKEVKKFVYVPGKIVNVVIG